jgi:hypothetical protein
MRWIFFRDVFGDWCWEQLSDRCDFVNESRDSFESRSEAEADAARHGYKGEAPEAGLPTVDDPSDAAGAELSKDAQRVRGGRIGPRR